LLNFLRDLFLSSEELGLDRIEAQGLSHAREAAAMNGESAEIFQGAAVLGSWITFVRGEPVAGSIPQVQ